MQKSHLKKYGKLLLRVGIPLIVLAFIIYSIQSQWQKLVSYEFHLQPWYVVLAFLGFMLQELSFGLIWRQVLGRLGYQLDLRPCLRVYLASEFVRYIPGNVWHVLTRILWVGKYGVPRPVALASMTIELITKLAAAAFIFAVSLFFWGNVEALKQLLHNQNTPVLAGLGGIIFFGLLIVLHPRILSWLLNQALRLLRRSPVVLNVRYRDILVFTAYWCVSWCIAGVAFYFLLVALWPEAPLAALPICIGINALAWDVGFLSIITPSGLGAREFAMGGLLALSLPLPVAIAGIIAILSRIVSTLAELLCVGVAYASGGQQVRAIQREEMMQSLQTTPEHENVSLVVSEESGV
ncbi:lysylphosphatidylglycerol synthase transmembrane domain-containing protein [Tengunoibacter tsumagoiensis]|uniref:Flippase-like domain-containing protein n=1 Tax=Tengunoibacter tsumagoiensis TaxID=2014871 RepID=A0A401ZYC0_9CHLR|nr:lysylphosphatidylglycerol synthase transmembrane domain-containing protein [Tengunoibacter tsumagoiensis]GCE11822.1 hypothetical protein KTT_16810 [Tengunoibacter tsumagoiensis]